MTVRRGLWLGAAASIFAAAGWARAQPDNSFVPRAPPQAEACESSPERPLLPEHLARLPRNYFVVGAAIERFGESLVGESQADSLLYGVAAMWRIKSFGPHILLMTKPSTNSYQNIRLLAGTGLRGMFEIPGVTEFSFGVGTHIEARLADHYWLAFATPAELGATIWRRGSWNIDLFLGVRRAMAGKLINHFLIDPNGIDNQDAQDELYRARHEDAWKGFIRLVFSRRID